MRTLLAFVITIAVSVTPLRADPMTDGERQRLLAHLRDDRKLAGQRGAADSPRRSSRFRHDARHLEHHGRRRAPRHRGAAVLEAPSGLDEAAGDDRTRRRPPTPASSGTASTAPNARRPARRACRKASGTNIKDSLGEFRKLRATMLRLRDDDAGRAASRRLIDGNMDVYQWFLMISTHSQRHVLQIREIKASPGYPRGRRAPNGDVRRAVSAGISTSSLSRPGALVFMVNAGPVAGQPHPCSAPRAPVGVRRLRGGGRPLRRHPLRSIKSEVDSRSR